MADLMRLRRLSLAKALHLVNLLKLSAAAPKRGAILAISAAVGITIALATLLTPMPLRAGGFPSGASTLPLLAGRGDDLACNQGDWAHCPNAQGGLAANKYHAYFVEIPAGTGNLTLQIFDADIGAGAAAGEAALGRDTAVATAAQAVQYSLRNPAGTVQVIRFDRGNGVAVVGATTTGIATAAGVAVSCSTAATTTADNAWCTLITVTNPAAGHWEFRSASVTGTPIHYMGIRAQDTSGSRDLNVYARSYIHYGNQNVNAGRIYNGSNAFYPYVTEGCQLRAADFDSDDEAAESIRYRSRTGTVDQTYTEAAGNISGNDAWNDELLTFTSAQSASQYGIWLNEVTSGTNSNHVTPWLGSELSTASPPTTQPQGGADRGTPVIAGESYRLYFPNNSGAAPTKPFVEQRLSFVSGTTPPTSGSQSIYRVTLSAVNPTPYPIDFADNASNDLVITLVPNDIPNTGVGRRDYSYVNPSFVTTCGSIVAEPANTADNAVIEWNPGTIPANTSCTAEYQVRLTPGTADTSGTVVPLAGNGATDGTLGRFLDETDTRFVFGPLCTLSLTVGTPVVVPVTLSRFAASLGSNGALNVEWGTDSEAGSIGFNLYSGDSAGTRRLLNQKIIAARGGNTLEATDYSAQLFGYDGKPLWIEEVADGGKSTLFGPFQPNQPTGTRQNRTRINWAPTRQALASERVQALANAVDDEARLRVAYDGAFRVRFEDIAATGLDWAGADSAQLALYVDGEVQSIAIDGGAIWGPGSALRFLGKARTDSLYTRERIYQLRRNDASAQPMSSVRLVQLPPVLTDEYRRTAIANPNNAWSFAAPIADPWYAFSLTRVGAQRPTQGLNFNAPNRVSAEDAVLRVSLWGGLNYEDGPDHRVLVDINGRVLADDRFDGIGARLLDRVLAADEWQSGDNTVNFTLEDSGFETDRVHIESVELDYRAQLRAESDRLAHGNAAADQPDTDSLFANGLGDAGQECTGSADCTGYRASDFQSPSILVYRQRDARVEQIVAAAQASGGGYAVNYGGDQRGGDRYVLSTLTAHRLPVVERVRPVVNLFAGAADYLAIAPAFMLDALEPLLAARRADGLTARAVAVEDIYPQFGDGSSDPEALRRFVQAAQSELGTRYLLIAGGDTYDYFNYTGANSVSLVPTFYRATHPIIRYGATDVPYGDTDGDGRLDIAVGRLPARNVLELQRLVAKTLQMNVSGTLPALLVADQPGVETDFGSVSDQFELSADSAYRAARPAAERVFLTAGGDIAAARSQMFSTINGGRQWVSYYGHGSPIGWTYAGLLLASDVSGGQFTNTGAPFLTTMWGCWGGFFVDPFYQGLSHALLVGSDAGAGVVIAASGLTETVNDERFAALLVPAMTTPGARLGDAFRNAQNQFSTQNPEARDVSMGMLLLGDPGLRLMQ